MRRGEGQSFGALRGAFWNSVTPWAEPIAEVPDEAAVLAVSTALYNRADAEAWIWMGALPADVCAYHWTLGYLAKHGAKLKLVSFSGLPFLASNGGIFFPKSLAEVSAREVVKARRLARPLATGEAEVDGETWAAIVAEDTCLRAADGGKKLRSQPVDAWDETLLKLVTDTSQKASRVVNQALSKSFIPTGDWWLGWRLRTLVEEGKLEATGDIHRPLKEWEVRQAMNNEQSRMNNT